MATLARKMAIYGPVGIQIKPEYVQMARQHYRAVAADIQSVPRVSIVIDATSQLVFDVPGKDVFIRVTHPQEMYELTGDKADRKWFVGVIDATTGEELSYKLYGASSDTATIARRADALYRKVSK